MSDLSKLRGCGTALVTPFQEDGSLDLEALRRLVRFQIDGGIDFLVPCGTTGETPTLSWEEHLTVIRTVVQEAGGRVPVIGGAGGYDTHKVVRLAQEVEALGVDGILSVSPYYNRPTEEGLYQHYKAIANAVHVPILIYNVPSRTGTNILPDTLRRLSTIDRILGVKEASGQIGQIGEIAVKLPEGFKLFSGDDANTLPIIAYGGCGVISVAANEIPAEMTRFTHLCLDGKFDEARRLYRRIYPLLAHNFVATNPIPVKAALAMMGMIKEVYRLPLVSLDEAPRKKMEEILKSLGVISP